jgi:Rieske Fe-S protein
VSSGRRNFIKALVGIGAILSLTPFIPWGDYLVHSVGSTANAGRQQVFIDNNPKYGAAAGQPVNVKKDASGSFTLFPPDSHWVITYPSSGDHTLDAQNPDTFVKFELIRLPAGTLGGDTESATAFVAFSKVCVHLWCSPNYNPLSNHEQYECPCHGSIYEIPDGRAVQGPASQQPPPTNAIPMLTLTAGPNGDLYVEKPIWDIDHNGIIGYGRNYQSYYNYIKTATPGSS